MKNDYPRFMFHPNEPPCIVNSEAEEKALGPEWSRLVHPERTAAPRKEPPPEPESEPEPELPEDFEDDEDEDDEESLAKQEPAKVAAAPAPVPKKRAPSKPKTRKK